MINFVSLGQSCQTTHQINYFTDRSPHSAGMVKSPFDWLICPPDSTAAWLENGLCDFHVDEIVEYRGHAYWPRFKLWFWHGFMDRSTDTPELKITEFAEQELAKLNHLRNKFRSTDLSNTHFCMSNTQNNLSTEVFEADEKSRYWFDEQSVDNLQLSLNNYFSSSTQLQIITRSDRCSSTLAQRDNVHLLPIDQSNWKGDKLAWGVMLRTLVHGASGTPLIGQ